MGGTRFRARGIDDDGNVANHCEFEQIIQVQTVHQPPIVYKNQTSTNNGASECLITKSVKLFSFVQVRGSMPFFWT